MQNTDLTDLLQKLPNINLTKDIPYSILNSLYTRISQKELAHSEILASFLNPAESHNHGNLFLKEFLIDIKLDDANNLPDFKNINVYTERRIKVSDDDNSRPIDILITYKYKGVENAIIIENKLNYAIDQKDQLNDYYNGIKREGYEVKKVVYMHINQHIKKTLEEVNVVNYNAQKLIISLEKCNINIPYSHITEYINLIKNNIQNYMYMETALEIQNNLQDNQKDFKKLVELSKIVNSKEWHEAKFEIILDEFKKEYTDDLDEGKLELGEVKKAAEFNAYYRSLQFKNQKYWLDVWSFDDLVKLYLCCKDEDGRPVDELEIGNIQFEYESNWGSWQYYKTKGSCIKYPSGLNDFKSLIKENLIELKKLKNAKKSNI